MVPCSHRGFDDLFRAPQVRGRDASACFFTADAGNPSASTLLLLFVGRRSADSAGALDLAIFRKIGNPPRTRIAGTPCATTQAVGGWSTMPSTSALGSPVPAEMTAFPMENRLASP